MNASGARLTTLLLSEPEIASLADALHYLKLSFTKRLRENWALQCRWNSQLSEPLGATSMIAQHAAVGGVLGCAEKKDPSPAGTTQQGSRQSTLD